MDFKRLNSLLGHYKLKAFYFAREIKTVSQEIILPHYIFPPLQSDCLAEKGGICECSWLWLHKPETDEQYGFISIPVT